mmetsp:Transcript_8868/g.10032  ORF Transcript_8868/g.10032 Transcript_8868/m.10032 type:complete len:83 (-) Transcript_8868:580-828(-)
MSLVEALYINHDRDEMVIKLETTPNILICSKNVVMILRVVYAIKLTDLIEVYDIPDSTLEKYILDQGFPSDDFNVQNDIEET